MRPSGCGMNQGSIFKVPLVCSCFGRKGSERLQQANTSQYRTARRAWTRLARRGEGKKDLSGHHQPPASSVARGNSSTIHMSGADLGLFGKGTGKEVDKSVDLGEFCPTNPLTCPLLTTNRQVISVTNAPVQFLLVTCIIVSYPVMSCYITLQCFNFVCIAICLLMKLFTVLIVKGGQH